MPTLRESMDTWLAELPDRLDQHDLTPRVEHIGRVMRVGDGVARISGLPWTRLDELLRFEDGSLGIALEINREEVGCVLLAAAETVKAGTKVFGTGEVARVPVGPGLLGRVVDATGTPLDNRPAVVPTSLEPIARPAPGIIDRDLVHEPLMTGVTVVDAMVPLGRGQRELIIGDRKTGKSALAVDTVINQKNTDVICVYALIGQKTSTVEQIIQAVRLYGNIDRCIFVVGEAGSLPGAQWLVPYAACTMAEYFRDNGQHALLVLDDLTKHAIVYRELSLLLRRPPGREAYPGDIFHIHSQLLERAAKLSKERGGGSLTALPIAETQAGNLSAYIPTNLISITDGQIFFEPKLFYEGQKPAVNVGLSVSRVGGATQLPIVKKLVQNLRLEYAQFLELEVFARFGAMADERTKKRIEHGRRIRAILTQPQYQPLALSNEVALLVAVNEGLLDALPIDQIIRFQSGLSSWVAEDCSRLLANIEAEGLLSEENQEALIKSLKQFVDQICGSIEEEDQIE
jgi:F-type H+-transporting ATPase subunit alpha